MANTCVDRFYIFGQNEAVIKDLANKIELASNIAIQKETPNQWGDFYEEFEKILNVNVVNEDNDFIRDVSVEDIEEIESKNSFCLSVQAEAKWSSNAGHMVRLIKAAYPKKDVRCFYEAEELGCCYYESNDIQHEFIKEDYIFEGTMVDGEPSTNYLTKKQLIDFLNSERNAGLKITATIEEINEAVNDGEVVIEMWHNKECPA